MAAMETINCEIFTLTYGSIVRQLVADHDGDVPAVNAALDRMGAAIGARLVDEFLARSRTARCAGFRDAAEAVARSGVRMFLGVGAAVGGWSPDGGECSITLDDNPLADHVELPPALAGLRYSAVLAGAVRGALEAVGIEVEAEFVRDRLAGDAADELRLRLVAARPEVYPFKDDE